MIAVLFLLAMATITIGIILGATAIVSLPFVYITKFVPKKYAPFIYSIGPLIVAYNVYRAIYPADSFYVSEFKEITGMSGKLNLKIVYGSASYPMIHGDYCSSALISTDSNTYGKILTQVKANSKFNDTMVMGSESFDRVSIATKCGHNYVYKASGRNKHHDYHFIGFFENNRILTHLCDN